MKKKIMIMLLTGVLSVVLAGCNMSEELGIEPIRITPSDQSKTETTDVICTVTDLTTEEGERKSTEYNMGYGYFGGNVGYGFFPDTVTSHYCDYYITVIDEEGMSCRFQIGELDWKSYSVGDTITLQRVQEYYEDGTLYGNAYIAFRGEKLKNAELFQKETVERADCSD